MSKTTPTEKCRPHIKVCIDDGLVLVCDTHRSTREVVVDEFGPAYEIDLAALDVLTNEYHKLFAGVQA